MKKGNKKPTTVVYINLEVKEEKPPCIIGKVYSM